MTSRSEVVSFLNLFKGCLMLDLWHVRDREKNLQGLIDLAISADDRKAILLGLTPEDYCAGPKPDDTDDSREVWEFGKDLEDGQIYIKLRVVEDPRRKGTFRAMVWSFHPAEYPVKHPLRGGGQ